MKRLTFLLLAVLFVAPVIAQNTNDLFNQLTEKYADTEGFSANLLTSDMFDLYIKKRNIEETSPVFEALKKLDRIMVVSQSKFFTATGQPLTGVETKTEKDEIHSAMIEHYKKSGYTLLKTEKRMGEDVKVYIRKNQEKIESFALVTHSNMATNLVELQGAIDLKTVADLNKALNLKGLENLGKIDNSSPSYGFTTGSYFSNEKLEEMAARQREVAARQLTFTDEQRAAMEDRARVSAEKQMQLAEKYREMAEKYGREPIFLSYPGDTNTVYYVDGKKVKAKEIKELDKSKIENIEINKAEKEGDKTTVKIKTKK